MSCHRIMTNIFQYLQISFDFLFVRYNEYDWERIDFQLHKLNRAQSRVPVDIYDIVDTDSRQPIEK